MTGAFGKSEEGSITILSVILFLAMFLIGGLAVDMLVFEAKRTHLQNVSDRASLAAADLDQTIDAEQVVESYFEKAGLAEYLRTVEVQDDGVSKSVDITASLPMKTMFMRMVGTTDLIAPAAAMATEAAGEVEVSLVLDNSGSMGTIDGRDGKTRLDKLKEAVETFLGIMYPEGADPKITVSIVPYAAQVNAGPLLTNLLNVTDEHAYSDCIEFQDEDFASLGLDLAKTYDRSGHFSLWEDDDDPTYFKCRPDDEQHVYVMGSDPEEIMERVDDLTAEGQTSLELGAKWGAALLDPSANPLVQALAGSSDADVLAEHANRPVAYSTPTTVKALILMTDGINTIHYNLRPAYKDGNSDLYRARASIAEVYASVPGLDDLPSLSSLTRAGIDIYEERTFYTRKLSEGAGKDKDRDGIKDEGWWTPKVKIRGVTVLPEQYVDAQIAGSGLNDGVLTWPEVWDDITVNYYADTYVYGPENSKSARNAFYDDVWYPVDADTKDDRLEELCTEARETGLTVYTVGLNVNDHSRGVLRDCASTENFFLDANSDNLEEAFEDIAQSILNSKLRLIH